MSHHFSAMPADLRSGVSPDSRRQHLAASGSVVLVCVLSGLACGEPPPPVDGVTVRDSAGVTLVRNGPVSAWTVKEAWWVEEVARSRPADDADAQLGYVTDAALAPDGRLYALDAQARAVRIFDGDGSFVGTLGGPGEGPGEFSDRVTSIEIVEGVGGPEVWVLDGLRATLHRFALDGTPIASASLAAGDAAWSAWLRRGRDGRPFLRILEYDQDEDGTWTSRDRLQALEWGQGESGAGAGSAGYGRGPALGDTLLVFDYPRDDMGKNSKEFTIPAVVNAPAWAVTGDGTVAWTALLDPELHLYGPDGELTRVRSDAWVHREPSSRDLAVLRLLTAEMLRMTGSWKGDFSEIPLRNPEVLPVHTGLVAGPGGTVWVQRVGSLEDVHPMSMNTEDEPDGWGGSSWEVFDGEGRFLGTVELPPRVRVTDVRDDRILGVRYDPTFVDELVVLEIRRGGDAP